MPNHTSSYSLGHLTLLSLHGSTAVSPWEPPTPYCSLKIHPWHCVPGQRYYYQVLLGSMVQHDHISFLTSSSVCNSTPVAVQYTTGEGVPCEPTLSNFTCFSRASLRNKGTRNPYPTVYHLMILYIMNREIYFMRIFFSLTGDFTTPRCWSGLPLRTR